MTKYMIIIFMSIGFSAIARDCGSVEEFSWNRDSVSDFINVELNHEGKKIIKNIYKDKFNLLVANSIFSKAISNEKLIVCINNKLGANVGKIELIKKNQLESSGE